MTVYNFHELSEKLQLDTLEQNGVLIAERKGAFFYQVKLYQIDGFYVELYFHTHFNVVVNINCFTNTDCLDPYLENIDVDALMLA